MTTDTSFDLDNAHNEERLNRVLDRVADRFPDLSEVTFNSTDFLWADKAMAELLHFLSSKGFFTPNADETKLYLAALNYAYPETVECTKVMINLSSILGVLNQWSETPAELNTGQKDLLEGVRNKFGLRPDYENHEHVRLFRATDAVNSEVPPPRINDIRKAIYVAVENLLTYSPDSSTTGEA